MHSLLLEQGAEQAGAGNTAAHMRQTECRVSLSELRTILETLGFAVETDRYSGSEHSMSRYGLGAARRLTLLAWRPRLGAAELSARDAAINGRPVSPQVETCAAESTGSERAPR